jgi:ATP-dependent RNA helicase RhlE
LVFTRTKRGADRVARQLGKAGIRAEAIHGDKTQSTRQRVLASFKSNRPPVLVATDLAARGIDVDAISHVFNYDLPEQPETYVHRIGRTGRAGASGQAIAFCDAETRDLLRGIERLIGQKLTVQDNHPEYKELPPEQHGEQKPAGQSRSRGKAQAGGGGSRSGSGNNSRAAGNGRSGGANHSRAASNGGARSAGKSSGRPSGAPSNTGGRKPARPAHGAAQHSAPQHSAPQHGAPQAHGAAQPHGESSRDSQGGVPAGSPAKKKRRARRGKRRSNEMGYASAGR